MTNADKIRLIASKMPWDHESMFNREDAWLNERGAVMAQGDDLTPAGASAVRNKWLELGLDYNLDGFAFSKAGKHVVCVTDEKQVLASVSANTEEDATRDAAAQYWSE